MLTSVPTWVYKVSLLKKIVSCDIIMKFWKFHAFITNWIINVLRALTINKTAQRNSQHCTKLHNEVHNVLHNKFIEKLNFLCVLVLLNSRKIKFPSTNLVNTNRFIKSATKLWCTFCCTFRCTICCTKCMAYWLRRCIPNQPFILPRSVKWVPGISGNWMVKNKLPPRSGCSLETVEPHP